MVSSFRIQLSSAKYVDCGSAIRSDPGAISVNVLLLCLLCICLERGLGSGVGFVV